LTDKDPDPGPATRLLRRLGCLLGIAPRRIVPIVALYKGVEVCNVYSIHRAVPCGHLRLELTVYPWEVLSYVAHARYMAGVAPFCFCPVCSAAKPPADDLHPG
jgi:hypothetical protein